MKKNFKNNLQVNETERWWNSKNILKFDNQYKKNYYDPRIALYQNSRMNKVYEFLNEEKFTNILEIGFGAGQLMSRIIKKKKINYYGVDISKPLLDRAKKRIKKIKTKSKINLSLQNVDKGLKFNSNKFDLIVAVGIFHYSCNLNKSLKEVYRILKPGGTFIIAQRSGYAISYLFDIRYLIRTFLFLISDQKYEIFPSFRSILCDTKLGIFFKKYEKNKKFFNSKFMLKYHDFHKFKIKKYLMTPFRLKKNLNLASFKILKFEGALFEVSLENSKLNAICDKYIKLFKLSWLFKNLTSVLVFKVKKPN